MDLKVITLFLSLEIDKKQLKRGKGFFKLSTSLHLDYNYKDNLQRLMLEKSSVHKNQNINPNLLWELVKSYIREYSIKYSSEIKKQVSEEIKSKERELNSLEALQESLITTNLNIETKILNIRSELKTYFEKKKQKGQ